MVERQILKIVSARGILVGRETHTNLDSGSSPRETEHLSLGYAFFPSNATVLWLSSQNVIVLY
jgi:hypothetical protein